MLVGIKRVGEKYELRMLPVMQKPFRGEIIPGILQEAGIAQKPKAAPSADAAISLFEALCAGWIDLCYQPKISMRNGRLIGADGTARDNLWLIGPLRRGARWETTAVPEIRTQARALIDRVK